MLKCQTRDLAKVLRHHCRALRKGGGGMTFQAGVGGTSMGGQVNGGGGVTHLGGVDKVREHQWGMTFPPGGGGNIHPKTVSDL